MNKNIINSDPKKRGVTSNVSNFQKEEKKAYVKSYVMTDGAKRRWLEEHADENIDDIKVIFPTDSMRLRDETETPERREKAKILIISLCAAAILMMISLIFMIFASRLVIKEIKVEGNSRYSSEDMVAACGFSLESGMPVLGRERVCESLLAAYPYLKTCEITLEFPNTVIISVTEEKAEIYTEIFGEYYALNSKLKILERAENKEVFADLLYVVIPRAERAVVGEKLVFADDEDGDYILEFLELTASGPLAGRLDVVYFEEKYDMVASADGEFRILFGSPAEMSLKLDAAAHIIGQNEDNCTSGSIVDVRVVDIAGIVINAGIDPEIRE